MNTTTNRNCISKQLSFKLRKYRIRGMRSEIMPSERDNGIRQDRAMSDNETVRLTADLRCERGGLYERSRN